LPDEFNNLNDRDENDSYYYVDSYEDKHKRNIALSKALRKLRLMENRHNPIKKGLGYTFSKMKTKNI
jgi:hypothetical protein